MKTFQFFISPFRLFAMPLAVLCLTWAWAEEPQPPPPLPGGEAATAFQGLPADCVFAVHADLAALRAKLNATPFGKFIAEPDSQAFMQRPLELFVKIYAHWLEQFPLLPRWEVLPLLGEGQLAFGLRLAPADDPRNPPRPAPVLGLSLADPAAVRAAMAGVIELLPVVKLASGLEARGTDGFYCAFLEDRFYAASEPPDLDAVLAAARGAQPGLAATERWRKVLQHTGAECDALLWADLLPIQRHLLELPEHPDARAVLPPSPAKLLAALGLDGVQSLALGLVIDGPRFDYRMALEAPAEHRRGLLKLLEGEGPLRAGMLDAVPPEAGWFYLTRMDPRRLLPLLKEGLEAATGDATRTRQLGAGLLVLKMLWGVDLEKDLLGGFGDTWLVSDAGGGGALLDLMPGIAVTALAKEPGKLEGALRKVWQETAKAAPPHFDARYQNVVIDGVSVHYLSLALTDISPAFAVLGRRVILSPTLAALRRQVRHVAALPHVADIRGDQGFQAAYGAAFGALLPVQEEAQEAVELPRTLRFLDSARSQPTRLLGTLFGAGAAFAPDLPERLRTETGLRRARLQAAVRMLGVALEAFRAQAGEEDRALPEEPRALLEFAGGGAAVATGLGGLRYRSGLRTGDPEDTVVAWAALEREAESPYLVLRLTGQSHTLNTPSVLALLQEQERKFAAAQRVVGAVPGDPAPMGRVAAWWERVWQMQEEERSLLRVDLLRLLREFDFALLPDLRRFDASLPAGVSWTSANDWGVVSRTMGSYPLPAADLTGALVPLLIGHVSLPEIYSSWRVNNQASAIAALRAIHAAQDAYRLVDWDGDGVHAYAGTLRELHERGLLDGRIAAAEVREGSFPAAKSGYFFRMLDGQGRNAPGGEKNFAPDGQWTQGFALLAWPAEYPKSGTLTFLLGSSGAVHEADHGIFTQAMSRNIKIYDPDPRQGWRRAE